MHGINSFECKFVLVINFKMPTIVGILRYMARTNNIMSYSQQEELFIFCLLIFVNL